jgi:ribosomal protein S18 acetylase RimI-like enzyme
MAQVRRIDLDEIERFVPVTVLAFSADPFVRWMLPESAQFLDVFTRLTRAHATRVAPVGGAFGTTDGLGAAFWYPPGTTPDGEVLGAIFRDAGIGERVAPVWDAVEQHEPAEPHWYLRQIGVDPTQQGRGLGGEVLVAGLEVIDATGRPAYLEATTEQSAQLYERHGFALLAEVSVGDAPPLWPMLRPAAGD